MPNDWLLRRRRLGAQDVLTHDASVCEDAIMRCLFAEPRRQSWAMFRRMRRERCYAVMPTAR